MAPILQKENFLEYKTSDVFAINTVIIVLMFWSSVFTILMMCCGKGKNSKSSETAAQPKGTASNRLPGADVPQPGTSSPEKKTTSMQKNKLVKAVSSFATKESSKVPTESHATKGKQSVGKAADVTGEKGDAANAAAKLPRHLRPDSTQYGIPRNMEM